MLHKSTRGWGVTQKVISDQRPAIGRQEKSRSLARRGGLGMTMEKGRERGAATRQNIVRSEECWLPRSLDCGTRRAIIRRAGENRVAPVPSAPLRAGGMTTGRRGETRERPDDGDKQRREPKNRGAHTAEDRPIHKKESQV